MPATARRARPVFAYLPADRPPHAVVALHTLGECRITVTAPPRDPADVEQVRTLTPGCDRLFTLALLLAADPGRPLPRARAAAWLWPDLPPAAARHALRQLAYRLRQLGVPLDGDEGSLTLHRRHVAPAPPAVVSPDSPPTRSARCLPDWTPLGPSLAAWTDDYRARTEARARDDLARALQAAPAPDARTRLAAALLELDPHHPLARATLPAPTRVREPARTPDDLPLVGRDDALDIFRAHAAQALAGRAPAVALTTTPGAGASRLLREFTAAARTLGFATLPTPHTADGFATALAAAVRTLLDRPGALGSPAHTLRALRRFTATPLLPAGDVPLRRLGAAIADLARTVAVECPLLLAVTAPCATAPERALAAAVARDLADSAALALFVFPAPGAPPPPPLHALPLGPLGDADAARLADVASRAAGRAPTRDDLAWCVATGQGRPGDVIALANACARRPGARDLPPSIAARLRLALAALPHRVRDVAALHAALGDDATPDALALTLARPRPAVAAALATLQRAGLPPLAHASAPPARRRAAARAFNAAARAALA